MRARRGSESWGVLRGKSKFMKLKCKCAPSVICGKVWRAPRTGAEAEQTQPRFDINAEFFLGETARLKDKIL